VDWNAFSQAAPDLAERGRALFDRIGVLFIGTLRKDGSPRVSGCEFSFFEDDLYLGMMWQSRKALDLLRDPRCYIQSAVTDKNVTGGEFKLSGRVLEVNDADTVERYGVALKEATGWRPEGPFHLSALDIQGAAFIEYQQNGDQLVIEWRPGAPPKERLRKWTGSGLVD
jgi:hypothetical protein